MDYAGSGWGRPHDNLYASSQHAQGGERFPAARESKSTSAWFENAVAHGMKRTPLYAMHRRAGAKMVEFAGWEMPVQYRGVIDEHVAVRQRAGLFDVSHMGEIEIRGPAALDLCQRVTANDVSRLKLQQAQYNLLMNENGGIVDDVIFYRLESHRFLICVNASNSRQSVRVDSETSPRRCRVEERELSLCPIGPSRSVGGKDLATADGSGHWARFMSFFFASGEVSSIRCLIARTGYTGEDGFELYCDPSEAERLWTMLLESGEPVGT